MSVVPRARHAKVAELADALDLGSSGETRESSSLSFRTRSIIESKAYQAIRQCGVGAEEGSNGSVVVRDGWAFPAPRSGGSGNRGCEGGAGAAEAPLAHRAPQGLPPG